MQLVVDQLMQLYLEDTDLFDAREVLANNICRYIQFDSTANVKLLSEMLLKYTKAYIS